jgi:hypothetical protein
MYGHKITSASSSVQFDRSVMKALLAVDVL